MQPTNICIVVKQGGALYRFVDESREITSVYHNVRLNAMDQMRHVSASDMCLRHLSHLRLY